MTQSALSLRNVSKTFGEFRAVDDISLEVPAGSIYGFLGPNGAGKTTTIRMILDIFQPTSGSLSILGHASAMEVRDRIGYLPEEKGLYKKMKAWAIVAYFASLKGIDKTRAKTKAYELLERYGLKDFADAKVEALSKGMGQKVQVLASIAHDPEFVILDEPFSGLDPANQQVMEDVIRDLSKNGSTIVFSTHVMAHAERMCDAIVLIAKGRKIFNGTIPEARTLIPRKVRLRTAGDASGLERLPEVDQAMSVADAPPGTVELALASGAGPEAVLRACYEGGLRLEEFTSNEPTLHDVFLQLVGDDAKEASFR